MRKSINTEQIDSIIQAFFDCNAPVKMYAAVKDMLEKLPVVEILKMEDKLNPPQGNGIPSPAEFIPESKGGEAAVV